MSDRSGGAATGSISNARRTTHELVLEMLRQRILSGELAVGSRLAQSELALSTEVGTRPVREALRDLASEGLVSFDPHVGAVVQELSSRELASPACLARRIAATVSS
jgi:DNA-binding GntR family transcriptional regulator